MSGVPSRPVFIILIPKSATKTRACWWPATWFLMPPATWSTRQPTPTAATQRIWVTTTSMQAILLICLHGSLRAFLVMGCPCSRPTSPASPWPIRLTRPRPMARARPRIISSSLILACAILVAKTVTGAWRAGKASLIYRFRLLKPQSKFIKPLQLKNTFMQSVKTLMPIRITTKLKKAGLLLL